MAQTDGVPLFIEELTKAVLESVSQPEIAVSALPVPSTLQASLMARLDRLPAAKQVAQVARGDRPRVQPRVCSLP